MIMVKNKIKKNSQSLQTRTVFFTHLMISSTPILYRMLLKLSIECAFFADISDLVIDINMSTKEETDYQGAAT